MALGNSGNNKGDYEPTYYSRIRFFNDENKNINFRYWKGLLGILISKGEKTDVGYNNTDLISAYLSPNKAYLLANVLEEWIANDDKSKPIGIVLGLSNNQTCVTVLQDDMDNNVYLYITKIDENGNKLKEESFSFMDDMNYTLEYNDFSKLDANKVIHNNTQVRMLILVLRSFVKALSGANAYATMDYMRFDNTRMHNKIDKVMDKLGIPREYNINNYSQNNGYFNKQENGNHNNKSQMNASEDIDDLIA